MPRLPRVPGKEVLATLKRAGFTLVRIRGSHHYLLKPDKSGLVTVPVSPGEVLPPKTLQSILQQAGLSVAEFIDLL